MTKALNNNVSANARLEAARAEFNARNAKAKATPAPEAQVADEPIVTERAASAINMIMDEINLPSFSRVIIGCILGLVVAAGFGYLFGYVLGALMIGAFAMTGSVFITQVIYVLGLIYAFIKGGKLAIKTSGYVIGGGIDTTYGKVCGWFTGKTREVKQAVVSNGAFQFGAA